jgi:hypothetical protein
MDCGSSDAATRGDINDAPRAAPPTSSNFARMFSVLGASAFLPFSSMLPIQLLMQNLPYDFSQLAIPFDRLDEESLLEPRRWKVDDIRSSARSARGELRADVLRLVRQTPGPRLALTIKFVEGLVSQALIVERGRRRANCSRRKSRAGKGPSDL